MFVAGGLVEESTLKLIQVSRQKRLSCEEVLHLKSQHRRALMLQISLISFLLFPLLYTYMIILGLALMIQDNLLF